MVSEDVLDADTLLGDLDAMFAEDSTGRNSGSACVAAPVPKKLRSKKKGDAMSCLPALAVDGGGAVEVDGALAAGSGGAEDAGGALDEKSEAESVAELEDHTGEDASDEEA